MAISIEELKNIAVHEIELPPFAGDKPFKVAVKRAGTLDMMYNGKVANPLMKIALEVSGMIDTDDEATVKAKATEAVKKSTPEEMADLIKLMMSVVENCMVEPSYKDIKDCGIILTDEQVTVIYNFALHGLQKAEKFRESP